MPLTLQYRLLALLIGASAGFAGCQAKPELPPPSFEPALVEEPISPLLQRPVDPFTADATPAGTVLDALAQRTGVGLSVNWTALELEGVDRQTPVSLTLSQPMPLGRVLDLLLRQMSAGFAELTAVEQEDIIVITTVDEWMYGTRRVGVYPVAQLLEDLWQAEQRFGPSATGGSSPSTTAPTETHSTTETRLIDLLIATFNQAGWDAQPSLEPQISGGVLILKATPDDHDRVAQFLNLFHATIRRQLHSAGAAR